MSGSSTMVRSKAAEVCPARIVLVGGTVSSVVSLDSSETTRFVANVPEMRTVPAFKSVPLPSRAEAGSVTTRFVGSLSCTMVLAKPSVQFGTCAVTVAIWSPSIWVSLTMVTLNTTEVCPAGSTTDGGT